MDKDAIVEKTAEYVKGRLEDDVSGHDWWHAWRVWKLSERIGEREGADLFVVQLSALLHDISDWKISGDEESGMREAAEWLESVQVDEATLSHVSRIIRGYLSREPGCGTFRRASKARSCRMPTGWMQWGP